MWKRVVECALDVGYHRWVEAVVQRADCAERVVVLEVRVPGRTTWVVIGAGRAALLTKDARQAAWGARLPPGFDRQKAREEALYGAYVVGLGAKEAYVDQKGEARTVRAQSGRVIVTDAVRADDALSLIDLDDERRAALERDGESIAKAVALEAIEVRRAQIARVIDKARVKIARRKTAIADDLSKIAKADSIATQAQWLVGEAARMPRGAKEMNVTDWSSGEAVEMKIPLDPAKTAREQVEAMFKRAKRLRLGGTIAERRMADTQAQYDGLAEASAALDVAKTLVEIEDAAKSAKKAAPRDVSLGGTSAAPAKAKKAEGRVPYRAFVARSGTKVLVGKGAADNDALTLKIARPQDLWLHAKDRTGAHVILSLDKGAAPRPEDLVDAAHLAAHFSDARDEKVIDVQYTPKRYIRKPKGSAPGAVVVDREKVLVLRVEPELVRSLLEREET